jgi:hypothetical protein
MRAIIGREEMLASMLGSELEENDERANGVRVPCSNWSRDHSMVGV